ncbi:MAG: hypothetical protein H6965_02410 [Chromatiaceae bacterium]|nr:hypothetical protein [Chromatiaceae bacterium]
MQGWIGYLGIHEFKRQLRNIDTWIRNRLRSTMLKLMI